MIFRRRGKSGEARSTASREQLTVKELAERRAARRAAAAAVVTPGEGPFDAAAVPDDGTPATWTEACLDLGSVRIPVPDGIQVQVEMAETGPQAVHLLADGGRLTISAFSAPKSGGQWRHVAAEIAENLRGDQAGEVTVTSGPWGREVVGRGPEVHVRFIGADGPRWMLRCVAVSQTGRGDEIAELARTVVADTVVDRGDDPMPVREALPIRLPAELAEQLRGVQEEARRAAEGRRLADNQAQVREALRAIEGEDPGQDPAAGAADAAAVEDAEDAGDAEERRRRSRGSAMQQLRQDEI